ncbi:MAG: hypothetical protein QM764_13450 [Chitinophagaceae bacterium]
MRKLLICTLTLLSFYFLQAQTLRRPVAAPGIGLGAYSNTNRDVFSFVANQASLARFTNSGVGIYGERRFLLNELSLYNIVFTLPTTSGNFAVKASYFGSATYNETQTALAYARKLSDKVDIGVQFNYNGVKASGYGTAAAISFEGGLILHLTDKLNAGIHLNNPVGGKYNKGENEKLPFVYTAGLGYEASRQFFASAEIQKEEDQPVNVNIGLQYKFIPQLFAKAGIATATSSYWFGLGTMLKDFRIDVITSYHPQLGLTPGLMIVYNFKSNQAKETK